MLPLGAMWFSGSAQSARAPNSIADSHWQFWRSCRNLCVAPELAAIVWPVITTCFARVYAGYHHPTYVVVGTLLGIVTTWAAGMMLATAPLCREQS
jgi:membrane-associated phospholipid phosphatase